MSNKRVLNSLVRSGQIMSKDQSECLGIGIQIYFCIYHIPSFRITRKTWEDRWPVAPLEVLGGSDSVDDKEHATTLDTSGLSNAALYCAGCSERYLRRIKGKRR